MHVIFFFLFKAILIALHLGVFRYWRKLTAADFHIRGGLQSPVCFAASKLYPSIGGAVQNGTATTPTAFNELPNC